MSFDAAAAPNAVTSPIFYTVTNNRYFPGTVATLSSIRRFYPNEPIYVFPETRWLLTGCQIEHLRRLEGVNLVMPGDLAIGTVREAFQLKAHAACYLGRNGHRCVIQVDSDAVICSRFDAIVEQVVESGLPAGGKDLDERYDLTKYGPYFALCKTTPADLRKTASPYISTSIFFLPAAQMQEILELWSQAVDEAHFGPKDRPRKIYAGYSDQGIFNALLYFKGISPIVLDNHLSSQHWKHGRDKIELKEGAFWNGDRRQLAFHSVGDAPKFWTAPYVGFVAAKSGNLDDVYRYWLSNLFDGACGLLRSASLTCLEEKQKEYFPAGLAHLFREYQTRLAPRPMVGSAATNEIAAARN